jgi:uncharacterized protein
VRLSIQELKDILEGKVMDLLKERLKPIIIYVFGSYAAGELREDSDIDIAFISDENLATYEVFMLAQEIADMLGREVDLVDLKNSSTVFKVEVVGKGTILFCSDEVRKVEFQMRALKDYAILNEDRQVVLDAIKKRGSVYGT